MMVRACYFACDWLVRESKKNVPAPMQLLDTFYQTGLDLACYLVAGGSLPDHYGDQLVMIHLILKTPTERVLEAWLRCSKLEIYNVQRVSAEQFQGKAHVIPQVNAEILNDISKHNKALLNECPYVLDGHLPFTGHIRPSFFKD